MFSHVNGLFKPCTQEPDTQQKKGWTDLYLNVYFVSLFGFQIRFYFSEICCHFEFYFTALYTIIPILL